MILNVYPNSVVVAQISAEDSQVLDNLLSVHIPGAEHSAQYKRRAWDGKQHFYSYGKFPRGLLFIVRGKQAVFKEDIVMNDYTIHTAEVEVKEDSGIEYREYQKEAIEKILKEKQGLVNIATNGGKSVIIAGVCKSVACSCLILTHRVEIREQLKEIISKVCRESVGEISAEKTSIERITVAMVPTLFARVRSKVKTSGKYDKRQDLIDYLEGVECLLIDEVHHAAAKSWKMVIDKVRRAEYRIGFSGTIARQNSYEGMNVRAVCGDILVKVKNKELIEAGYSATPEVRLLSVDCTDEIEEAKMEFDEKWRIMYERGEAEDTGKSALIYGKIYEKAIVFNQERNSLLVKAALEERGKCVLMIIERIEHGELLLELLQQRSDLRCAFLHGQSRDRLEIKRKFSEREIDVLIVSTIFDEGVDVANIDVLILGASRRSDRKLLQRVGRGLRKKKEGENSVVIYDVIDIGGILLKHSKERVAVYRKEGFEVKYVEV